MPEVDVVIRGQDLTTQAFKKVEKSGKKSAEVVNKAWKRTSENLQKVGGHVTQIGSTLTKLAAPLAIVGVLGVSAAANFEQRLADVSTLIQDDVGPTITKLGDGIKDMMERVPKDADDLGASLYSIFSAGINKSADALRVLEDSAILATAGLGSTEEATTIMTVALNAFGIAADQSGRVSDVLFKTVKNGITTVAKLQVNFGQMAGQASAVKVKFEEVMAANAALTSITGKTAQSQTQLTALFREMGEQGGVLDKALKKNKFSLEKFRDLVSEKGLGGALKNMKDRLKLGADEFGALFGSAEAAFAAVQLATAANDTYTSSLDEMLHGSDAVREAFRKQMETFNNNWKLLKNKLNVALINLGSKILPALLGPMNIVGVQVKRLSTWFGQLSPTTQKLILVFGAVAIAVGPVLVVLGTLITTIGTVMGAVAGIAGFLGIAAGALLAFAAIGVGAIALLAIAWTKNWGNIRQKTADVINELEFLLKPMVTDMKAAFETVSADVIAAWEKIAPTVMPILQDLMTFFEMVMPHIKSLTENYIGTLWTVWKVSLGTIYEIVKWALGGIWGAFNWLNDNVGPVLGEMMFIIVSLFQEHLPKAKEIVVGTFNEIVAWLSDLDLGKYGEMVLETFAAGIRAAAEFPLKALKWVLGKLRKLLPGSDAEEGPLSDLTASGQGMMETYAEGIQQGTPAVLAQVNESMGRIAAQSERILEETGKRLSKRELKQAREQAVALVERRGFDNLTMMQQLEKQAAEEIAFAKRHGQETAEVKAFWRQKIQEERERERDEDLRAQEQQTRDEEALRERNLQNHLNQVSQRAALAGQVGAAFSAMYEASGERANTFFALMKAASIAEGLINANLAATRAVAEGGPFLGPALAAAIYAGAIANVAAMAAQTIAMAEGGIVTRPTRALIGEAGPEAVIPLNKMGFGGQPVINNYTFNMSGVWTMEPAQAREFYRNTLQSLNEVLSR